MSVQSVTKRTGNYALKIAHSASNDAWFTLASAIVPNMSSSVYVFFDSLPATNVTVMQNGQTAGFERRHGIGIHGGKWATWVKVVGGAGAIVWGADGPSVSTGVWYQVSIRCIKTSGTPDVYTTEGFVNTTALGTATDTSTTATSSLQFCILGNQSGVTGGGVDTYTNYFDDLVQFGLGGLLGTAPWPIQPYAVEILVPVSEGTHVSSSKFTDHLGNSPPASPQAFLDDIPNPQPGTSYFYQNATDAAAYLEFNMSDLTLPGTTIYGIRPALGMYTTTDGSAFVDTPDTAVKIVDVLFGAATDIVSSSAGSIGGNPDGGGQSSNLQTRLAGGDPNFDRASVNALILRCGFLTSDNAVDGQQRFHIIWIEVCVTTGVPGIGSWQLVG
jgi:hypothetical protein